MNKNNKNKNIYEVKKLETDENESFSYIRSFITFYYYIIIIKSANKINDIKDEFMKYYGNENKYFDFFYEEFIKNNNPLIFTYFNNIPINFFPYIDPLYYYYPSITFYDNRDKKQIYKMGNIEFNEKILYKYIPVETYKTNKNELQITIPLKYFKNIKNNSLKSGDKYILLKIGNEFITILANNINILDDIVTLKNYYYKNDNMLYYKFNKNVKEYNFNDVEYICILNPITKKLFDRVFKYDTLKKNSYFYHIDSTKFENLNNIRFVFLYPKVDAFRYDEDHVTYCRKIKLKKDLIVLNLNVDIFYNNDILKLNNLIKDKYKYIDIKNDNYEKNDEDEIYRCINNGDELSKRLGICNLTKKKFDYLTSESWSTFNNNGKIRKNMGKDFLNLLIFKNKYLSEYNKMWYVKFLQKYDITSFIYNYGYAFDKNNKKIFYDTELFFYSDVLNINDYFSLVDIKEGRCSKLYKKGKLLNETSH